MSKFQKKKIYVVCKTVSVNIIVSDDEIVNKPS